MVNGDALAIEQVAAFLADQHAARIEDLEPLGGGWWSSAWGYRIGDEELVVRFGRNVSWYEADRMAMAFARHGIPVPQVREVGLTPDDRACAISVRHHGNFLEDTPLELSAALAPTFTGLLVALHAVPSETHSPVLWHQPDAPLISWRQYLLSGLVDDPRARHMARAPRWPPTPISPRLRRELKKGFGLSRTSVRSVGTSCMVTCFTATSLSVRTPAGSMQCSRGSALCVAISSSTPRGAASGRRGTKESPPSIRCRA